MRNYDNQPPLHYAITARQYILIQLLLQAKANPNLVDSYNDTPLHDAITAHVNGPTLELLLLSHANPNLKKLLG